MKTEFDDVGTATVCDPADESQNCLEAADSTLRIDDETKLQFVSGDSDPAKGVIRLELKPGATLDPRFKAGTILVRGRKDRRPLLHRIEDLRVTGSTVEIKLSPARAKDAFKRARLRVRAPLGAMGPTQGTRAQSRPLMRDGELGVSVQPLTIAPIGPQDCSGTVLDSAINQGGVTGNVKLDFTTCRFVLTAWVDATLRWDSIINVDKIEVSVGGSVDAALHAKLDAAVTGAAGKSKTIWKFADIPITIGGLVLTLTPTIEAGWDLSGKATLSVEQGFDYTGSIEEGFGYGDKRGWYSIDERESTFSHFGPTVTFDGSVTATAWIRPRIDLQAFGIVGGYVAIKTFAEGVITSTGKEVNGAFTGNVCTDLSVGLTPTVGASADVFGVKLFDEDIALGTVREKLIDNACIPYSGPFPSDCDLSSACCNDGQCAPATTEGVTVQCEKGPATSGGKFKYACKQSYPLGFCLKDAGCDDKQTLTKDTCVANRCENTLPPVAKDPAEQPLAGVTTFSASCPAPSCCFTNTDCSDGNVLNVDTCTKPAGSDLNTKGSCTYTAKKAPIKH